jgi:hypothetical protein
MLKRLFLISTLLITGCDSDKSTQTEESMEDKIIGSWESSDCVAQPNDFSDNNYYSTLLVTFSDTDISYSANNYEDTHCSVFVRQGPSPIESKYELVGKVVADTGEEGIHLQWEFVSDYDREVTYINEFIYVEGENLYFGKLNGVSGSTSIILNFNTPYYKQ